MLEKNKSFYRREKEETIARARAFECAIGELYGR